MPAERADQRGLLWPVVAGVILVAVPTVFGVYPTEAGTIWVGWRDAIGGAWLLVAGLTVAASSQADERISRLFREVNKKRVWQRARATSEALEALLRPGTKGFPDVYRFSVYLFDEERQVLLPWYPKVAAEDAEVRTFAPGIGATGAAWSDGQTLLVTDDEVSSDRYHLSKAQQLAFRGYRAVSAAPMRSTAGVEMGMLTAISTVNDRFFDDAPAVERFEGLAEAVGAVVELMSPR